MEEEEKEIEKKRGKDREEGDMEGKKKIDGKIEQLEIEQGKETCMLGYFP